jgi:hypothetical protein
VRPNQRVQHIFSIPNSTARAWTLRGIENNCSCTVPKGSPQVAPAGGRLEITVDYMAAPSSRDDRRVVTVRFHEREVLLCRSSFSLVFVLL